MGRRRGRDGVGVDSRDLPLPKLASPNLVLVEELFECVPGSVKCKNDNEPHLVKCVGLAPHAQGANQLCPLPSPPL